jgi:membrane dipeptidase
VRNISDDLIRACAARGGVIGMNSLGFMLDAENRSKAAKFVDHVRYVADLVGRGHVALGMDWNFYDPFMQQMFRENPGMAALGYPPPPWDSLPPDRLPRIVERLTEAGWSDADVADLLGQNMMRIARQVWPGG